MTQSASSPYPIRPITEDEFDSFDAVDLHAFNTSPQSEAGRRQILDRFEFDRSLAAFDGATPIGIFRQLTLPHLRRYLELGALLGSIYIVQAFDAIDVMTGGGPGSTNVPYFVYQESIGGGFRYGSASAYAIVVVVFSIIIATLALRLLSGLLKDEERA